MLAMTMREWIPAFAGMEILMSVVHFLQQHEGRSGYKPDPTEKGYDFDPTDQ
jgi:hypothetical protein